MTFSCRFPLLTRVVRALMPLLVGLSFAGGMFQAGAQSSNASSPKTSAANGASTAQPRMRGTTNAQRQAAAAHAAVRRATTVHATRAMAAGVRSNAVVGAPGAGSGTQLTLDQLYFSGVYPNYANSPLPNANDTVNCAAPNWCGLRKFVDSLPLLNQANDLGMSLRVAVPDTITFPGSDYYEISLVEYHQQMHSDLPKAGTQLRGYVQTNYGTDAKGNNTIAPQAVSYLGPIIVAHSNRAVRIKFTNALDSVNSGGNLFIPVDTTALGAGLGLAKGAAPYLQNRATVHLHGGNTPWISDGTPHQWTVPAADWNNTPYTRGDSVAFVPDMYFVNGAVVPQCGAVISGVTYTSNCSDPSGANNATTLPSGASNDPGPGSLTFYYTNQQSARLLFYHDHSYGTTRLNVYAGEAGGYVIRDGVEADLTSGSNTSGVFASAAVAPAAVLPSGDAEIPLVIQDKTFVPQNPGSTTVYSVPLLENGSGYTNATISFSGGCATEPTATATIGTLMDPYGQFIYGAITGINLVTAGSGCTSDPSVTISGNGTGAAAFASIASLSQQDPTWDSALWGSYGNLWYPHVYMTNQWPGNPDGSGVNPMGRWDYASWFWPPFNGNPGQYTVRGEIPCPTSYDPTMTCPGVPSVLAVAPGKELNGDVHQGVGSTVSMTPEGFMDTPVVNGTAYPTLTVDPKPYRFRILSVANERTFNLSWFLACDSSGNAPQYKASSGATCPAPTVAGINNFTEVGMVPAVTTAGFPVQWPSDGRAGGVPDPASMGPNWIQIGNEGGVLPLPAVIPPTPISYEQNMRSVTVTNIQNHGLLLMSAERADAIVDFTPYAGKTLILYNDAPAPAPGFDARLDYYTGDSDQTGTGGAPTTLAGFGPNTRTIMQVHVNSSVMGPQQPAVNMATLNAVIPAAFRLTQPVPVVPEPAYNKVYGQSFKAVYPALQSTQLTFTPLNPITQQLASAPVTLNLGFKTIQELFDLDYGRMNATLGTELPLTNYNTQTTIPLGYVDPFTEDIYDSANVAAQPVGVAGDGTQIWMVVHNGVDSHAIHFHLYNVQLINRFGWDGSNRPPFPDELGWKDTVRMNPLEMDFVALRPVSQTLPFPVPDSERLFDVTKRAGSSDMAMSNVGPTGQAFAQINQVQPMGWEYVWHCHLLGHEENDMMREQVFQVPPQTPVNLKVVATSTGNLLTFTDMSLSEAGFNVQRADDALFSSNVTTLSAAIGANPGWNTPVSWKDTSAALGHPYFYRVQSYKADADYWNTSLGTGSLPNLVSAWSAGATLQATAAIGVNPLILSFGTQAYQTVSASQAITVSSIGLMPVLMSNIAISGTNAADFAFTTSCPITPTSLAINSTCSINVTFKPAYAGARTANLVINSNDPTTPALVIPLTGNGGLIPLTITASSPTVNWGTGVPLITPIVSGLVAPDTIASLGAITCSTTYTATSNAGTYPTTCSGAVNPAYALSYVGGKLIVNPIQAVLLTPSAGSTLTATTATFTWTSGGAVPGSYQIWVGTGRAKSDIFNSGVTHATTANVSGIPSTGLTFWVRLMTLINGVWQFTDYTFTEPSGVVKAALTAPSPGVLTSSPVTFSWTTGSLVTGYRLTIGTTVAGASDLFDSGQTTALSASVPVPQNGMILYVRLLSLSGGVWVYTDYTFTEGGTPVPAAMISVTPISGNQLQSSSVTFTWTPGVGALAYQLWVGTGRGKSDIFNSGMTHATTANVSGIPSVGLTLYVRLMTLINGVWQFKDYTYTEPNAAVKAALTAPSPGVLTSSPVTFSWTTGSLVTAYRLTVGTIAAGGSDLFDSGQTTALSASVPIPQNGMILYVRLLSLSSGVWVYTDYTFTEGGTPVPAAMVSVTPISGNQFQSASVTFTWTPGVGVLAYQLWVGTGNGKSDLYNSGQIHTTSVTVNGLPTGTPTTVYVRVLSLINGVSQYNNYTYTTK